MPRANRLEDAPNIATLETIQTFEFAADLDSPFFTAASYRQGATPQAQIENYPARLILQRSLISDEVGVVIDDDFREQVQK